MGSRSPHAKGVIFRGKDMPGHARRHCRALCKNGRTDPDAVSVVDSWSLSLNAGQSVLVSVHRYWTILLQQSFTAARMLLVMATSAFGLAFSSMVLPISSPQLKLECAQMAIFGDFFWILCFQRAACSRFQTYILNSH